LVTDTKSGLPESSQGASVKVRFRVTEIQQPVDPKEYETARFTSMSKQQSLRIDWETMVIPAPDVSDRSTLLNLARGSWDAYHPMPEASAKWYPVEGFNWSVPFGWNPGGDGLKGHLFLSPDNATGLIVFKGTTLSEWPIPSDSNNSTSRRDRINNNLLFSCCCATMPWRIELGHPCDCNAGGNKCQSSCLSNALHDDSTYYTSAENVVKHFRESYPDTSFWLTGHSLGGSIASLIGQRFGYPTVTFEAPPERLAATRLHLLVPPAPTLPTVQVALRPWYDVAHITHVYNNADPLAQGNCTGVLSLCAQAGYALESKCRVGRNIVYDVLKKGWDWGFHSHRMGSVISLLEEDLPVPEAAVQDECEDCTAWEYGDFPDSFWQRLWKAIRRHLSRGGGRRTLM